MLLVNLNAMVVTMQIFILESYKEGIENRGMDPSIYYPGINVEMPNGEIHTYMKDEILNLHKGPIKQEIIDLCMARHFEALIRLVHFF